MKKSPLVSIIMNCYNGEKFLKESIQSVISQKYTNWELIFWDNNSNDSMESESGFKFENILPSGGAGLRFLLFQEKDIYLRLDYGITGHGNNYYITLGEAF